MTRERVLLVVFAAAAAAVAADLRRQTVRDEIELRDQTRELERKTHEARRRTIEEQKAKPPAPPPEAAAAPRPGGRPC